MKHEYRLRRSICGFLAGLAFAVCSIAATPTPTPGVQCPAGTPAGTLSVEYQSMCSACVPVVATETPSLPEATLPAYDIDPACMGEQSTLEALWLTATPIATVSMCHLRTQEALIPTATPAPTQGPTQEPTPQGNPVMYELPGIPMGPSGQGVTVYDDATCGADLLIGVRAQQHTGPWDEGALRVNACAAGNNCTADGPFSYWGNRAVFLGVLHGISQELYDQTWSVYSSASAHPTTPGIGYASPAYFWNHLPAQGDQNSITAFWYNGNTTGYLFPICYGTGNQPTPTPTVEPTPGGCGTYQYQADEPPLVDYGGLSILQGECVPILPAINIELPAVGELIPAISLHSEGVSICPKWVDLGTFAIAEYEIPGDILLLPLLVFLLSLIFYM